MPVISKLNYLRISPRKVRLVADLIRKRDAREAEQILRFTIKKGTGPLLKLLKTALADAENNFQLAKDNLYISTVIVNEGPTYKRWRPRSKGMANPIKKRTSHVVIVLEEKEKAKTTGKINKKKEKQKDGKEEAIGTKKSKKVANKKSSPADKNRPEVKSSGLKPQKIKNLNKIFRRKSF